MHTRKVFSFILLISLLVGTTFSPVRAEAQPAWLHSSFHAWEKNEANQPQAPTATISVCASGCDFSSIQAAIDASSDGDTIDLASETFTEAITVDKSITIFGDGIDNTIIQAANAPGIASSRVMTITEGVTTTIQGVTVRYGNENDNQGGGIHNAGALTLYEIEVSNNIASNGGGGVASNGPLTVSLGIITNNHSNDDGGGIYAYGGYDDEFTTHISDTTFDQNTALGNGGGLYTFRGSLDANNLTVYENQADDNGGGIYVYGQATILNSQIISNTAYQGGGTYNSSILTLKNCSIEDNNAGYGGGIYNHTYLTLLDSTVIRNQANYSGGGIFNTHTADFLITGSTIGENQANNYGGGVYIDGYSYSNLVTIEASAILSNTALVLSGGGINNNGKLQLIDSVVAYNNAASNGGGINSDAYYGALTVLNSTISNNTADNQGGGIYTDYGLIEISHSTIAANTADYNNDGSGRGGGLYDDGTGGITRLRNTIITHNIDLSGAMPDCGGPEIESQDYNLIGDTTGCTLLGSAPHDILDQPAELAPLGDYGGETQTHALLSTSPAIDSGVCSDILGNWVANDQRGYPRPSRATCDMGAFEKEGLHINKTINDLYPNPGQVVTFTLQASNTTTNTVTSAFISDTLPTGLEFAGPITLEPAGVGTVGSAPPILVSELTLDPGNWVTVTIPVTISNSTPYNTIITNTAIISSPAAIAASSSEVFTICGDNITVTSNADDGPGSLREALTFVCPGGQIDFNLPPSNTITLTSGELLIEEAVSIIGPGAENLAVSGNHNSRVFYVVGEQVIISGLAIRDGNNSGISNSGSLTIIDSLITNNNTASDGGGIYNSNLITITNSAIISNTAISGGGGLANRSSALITNSIFRANGSNSSGGAIWAWTPYYLPRSITAIDNCLIDNNLAEYSGGAIYLSSSGDYYADLTIRNSTINNNSSNNNGGAISSGGNDSIHISNSTLSGNSSSNQGGAIYFQESNLNLNYVTLNQNSAPNGGNDLFAYQGNISTRKSIFASNDTGPSCAFLSAMFLNSFGYNLGIDDSCQLDDPTDLVNTDPLLKQLNDNGGGTPTHALDLESPAIDAIPVADCYLMTDQRGVSRPVWHGCDIGAYESDNLGISKSVNNPFPEPGQLVTFTIKAINLSSETVIDGVITDSLPAGLTFVGPVTLEPSGAGNVGTTPSTLASNLQIAFGEQITLTFPVTVDSGNAYNTIITNTAEISSSSTSLQDVDTQVLQVCDKNVTVISNADSGAGSLRQAIVDVCPGGIIDFGLTIPSTITLSTGELVIAKPLIIQGPGMEALSISGNNTQRVFNISSDGVTIHEVTIRDGSSSENGGGIYHTQALTLTESQLISNTAQMGAGIYTEQGTLNFNNSIANNNTAFQDGGGIYVNNGILNIANSDIEQNTAVNGGGIYIQEVTSTISATFIKDNEAASSGGGIFSYSSDINIISSTSDSNSANKGGGVYIYGFSSSEASITGTNIISNTGEGSYSEGGGIFISNGITNISNSNIISNTAGWGAGVFNNGNAVLSNSIVSSNISYIGGGIYNNSSISVLHTEVTNNSSGSGGGIYASGSNTIINNSSIYGNSASANGGGINQDYGSVFIENTTISSNTSSNGGGGLYRNTSGELSIINSTISENYAEGFGGGIYNISTSGSARITNSTIAYNNSTNSGGIYQQGGRWITFRNTILANNIGGENPECGGDEIYSLDYNLIGNPINCSFYQKSNDLVGIEPSLGLLKNNGGDTLTHALLLDSPAIDTGSCEDFSGNLVLTDQRNITRPQGNSCDIGSYEFIPDIWLIKTTNDSFPLPGQVITFTIQLTNHLTETITDGVISDTLPNGLNFVGPISLDPPLSGTVGSAPPWVATNLVIAPGQQVTATFPVSVSHNIGCGTQITNKASASSSLANAPAIGSESVTIPQDAYPPVVRTVCANGCDFNSIQTAIEAACTADIIELAGETFTEPFTINKDINILGQGSDASIVQAASEPGIATSRVITVTPGVQTTIQGVTIRYGNTTDGGGGIFNQGTLTLTHSTIFSNTASSGGGLYNLGGSQAASVNIDQCSFSENTATSGGGLSNYGNNSPAFAQIKGSTFFDNYASSGGGIENTAWLVTSAMTITNSTISRNQASNYGGGIMNSSAMGNLLITIVQSTISENSANMGGGIYSGWYSTMSLSSSILANSLNGNDCYFGETLNDNGYNLVEDGSCGFPTGGDPMLGPLQDNGGPTWTHALLPGSPAIDAIPVAECSIATDQRGVARPQGSGCDIGAFELERALKIIKSVDNPTPLPGEIITFTLQVTNNLTDTITGGLISDTLPSGLNFLDSITLEPTLSGTLGSAPPILVTDLEIGVGEQITVTFPVSVSLGLAGGTVITNTAWVTSSEVITPVLGSTAITIANAPPVGVDDNGDGYLTDEDTPFTTGDVLINDHDLNNDPLSVSGLDTTSTLGLVSDNGNGTFDYDPNSEFDYLAPGEQAEDQFSYIVSDGVLTDTAVVTITIQGINDDPTVEAGPNQTVDEGDLVQFQGSFSDPGLLAFPTAGETILWDFGDRDTATATLTPTHTYLDNGVFTVTLTVTDTLGGVGSDWLLVTVENVAPTLSDLPDLEVSPGETFTITGTITDLGVLDTQTVEITWAEGITETLEFGASEREFTLSYAYTTPGEHPVTITVTDKDGGWSQKDFVVTVNLFETYLPLTLK